MRAALDPGDCLLLGVDLVKEQSVLQAAYDDAAGVTAAFNRNVLVRLNRELDADFRSEDICASRGVECGGVADGDAPGESRRSRRCGCPAIDLRVNFEAGESIHTENSYKYRAGRRRGAAGEGRICARGDVDG